MIKGKNITEKELSDLCDKAIKRTIRMGAESTVETIALLENEIDEYRSKIKRLEEDLENANLKIHNLAKEEILDIDNQKPTINIEYLTVNIGVKEND